MALAKAKPQQKSLEGISLNFPGKILSLLREIGLISLLALAGYLLVCLVSYSPADPGPTHTGAGDEIANLGGRVGAWIADLLFTLFGNMSYLFLLLMFLTGWRIYREKGRDSGNGWSYFLPRA